MKKLFLSIFVCLVSVYASAQLMRAEELEKYAVENYGDKWTDAAENLSKELVLDKNNSLTYVQVVDCGEQTKEQLYITLNHWFTASFNDANSVIQLNDKDAGVIIAKGFIGGIASHTGGSNSYVVSISPIIRVDIKDTRIRISYTIQSYEVDKYVGGGVMGSISGSKAVKSAEKWALEKCFPFQEKDGYKAKKSSSKALVMTHAYSNVVMDKIEEAVKNGLIGNENDNW